LKLNDYIHEHGNDLAISIRLITKAIGNEGTVKSAVSRKCITTINRGWYSFKSLEKYNGWGGKIIESVGLKSPLPSEGESAANHIRLALKMEQGEVEKELKKDKNALLPQYWAKYYNSDDVSYYLSELTDSMVDNLGKKCRDLATGKAILMFLAAHSTKAKCQKIGYKNFDELLRVVGSQLEEIKLYAMPESYHGLKKKYYSSPLSNDGGMAKADELRAWLVPKTFGNDNRELLNDRHKAILVELYARPNKTDMLCTWEDYVALVTERALGEPVKYSRAKQFLQTENVQMICAEARHGKQIYEQMYGTFVHRYGPKYSLEVVCGDGWVPGVGVIAKDGKKQRKMNVWLWVCAKSLAITGYEINEEETARQIREGFRNIIKHHEDRCPSVVVMDKKWEKNEDITQMMARLGVEIKTKRAYNPKSNPAERVIKEFNKLFRQWHPTWVNMTVGYTIDNRHNLDVVKKREPLTQKEFAQMISDFINIYNNRKNKETGKSPMEVLKANFSQVPNLIDWQKRTYVFGSDTTKRVANGWFAIQIANKKYEYQVPVWDKWHTMNIKDSRVRVVYDETMLDYVQIYKMHSENRDDDSLICICPQLGRTNFNPLERTEQDKQRLNAMMGMQSKTENEIRKTNENRKKLLDETGIDAIDIKGVTQKRLKEVLYNAETINYDYEQHEMVENMAWRTENMRKDNKIQALTEAEKRKRYESEENPFD
jgi:hypothetical protein